MRRSKGESLTTNIILNLSKVNLNKQLFG